MKEQFTIVAVDFRGDKKMGPSYHVSHPFYGDKMHLVNCNFEAESGDVIEGDYTPGFPLENVRVLERN